MTAQELFSLAVGRMGVTPSNATSYNDTIIPQINTILADTFTLENNVRVSLGLTPLTSIPEVTALSQTLTYQDSILKNCVAWGVCQLLALSDDDTIKSGFFESRYQLGKNKERKFNSSDIKDYFGGEE